MTPTPPPCPAWCTVDHASGHGGWDGEYCGESAIECQAAIGIVEQDEGGHFEIQVDRFASTQLVQSKWVTKVSTPRVRIGEWDWVTPDQAEAIADHLGAAARLARAASAQ